MLISHTSLLEVKGQCVENVGFDEWNIRAFVPCLYVSMVSAGGAIDHNLAIFSLFS